MQISSKDASCRQSLSTYVYSYMRLPIEECVLVRSHNSVIVIYLRSLPDHIICFNNCRWNRNLNKSFKRKQLQFSAIRRNIYIQVHYEKRFWRSSKKKVTFDIIYDSQRQILQSYPRYHFQKDFYNLLQEIKSMDPRFPILVLLFLAQNQKSLPSYTNLLLNVVTQEHSLIYTNSRRVLHGPIIV